MKDSTILLFRGVDSCHSCCGGKVLPVEEQHGHEVREKKGGCALRVPPFSREVCESHSLGHTPDTLWEPEVKSY